jgi:DNA end-binding protein Ku
MARSIWKGTVGFGLVTIPVKLYGATEEKDVSFHQVRRSDGSRIRYKRVAEADGEEVPYADIAKGYALPGGEVVVLTDEDFADLPLPTQKQIDVTAFVPLEQVDPIYFSKSYYLEPEKNGTKPYVLLRDALEASGRVALVKVALRNREQLAVLRVKDGVFVLETMLWPDEIRAAEFPFLSEDVDVRPQELHMAQSLIETLAGDFEPEEYHDDYREALQALIDAKVEGHEVKSPAATTEPAAPVLDLMAALRASVEAAKGGGAAPAEPATKPAKSARKAPAAKAARKTAAKGAGKGAGKAPPAKTHRKAGKGEDKKVVRKSA